MTNRRSGAKRDRERVLKSAEQRANTEWTPPDESPAVRGLRLLEEHGVKQTPANITLARVAFMNLDAMDRLYHQVVIAGIELRQTSSLVSAGKQVTACLEKLGVLDGAEPGDLPWPMPGETKPKAKASKAKKKTKRKAKRKTQKKTKRKATKKKTRSRVQDYLD